ncbi:plus-3-domain-containing protein [Athelia psychrophila]|uniref:Plus-3-domain-containing protein n=1 Tax=Athelia psychrophila TaxID=1759441 RepID=A0A166JWB5_9AGAM|nr:plus-3-domain-containing protein [Fibularhizoctonia sp. CBS 109695]
MSDFEDIDDELLELAGATEKKRKKRQASSSKPSSAKRRKADVSSESEDEPESEEEESSTPYPVEGKYKDEADRQRLTQLSEIEREAILGERLEEMQRIIDKREVDKMFKEQKGGDDNVAKAAKRQHTVRGATKEKSKKLDELKARRRAKDDKKRSNGSPRRERSSSAMEMETDSEDEEDGQITKHDEEEEKDRKRFGKVEPSDDEPVTMEDIMKCRLTRTMLAKYCMSPWFEDYIKGAWVRYLIGQENGVGIYRVCEITNLGPDLVKPYKIDDKTVNHAFELKHGKSVRLFNMDKVSNSEFLPKEFDRVQKVWQAESVKLPTKRALERKSKELVRLSTQTMTESDITTMLARKNDMQAGSHSQQYYTMQRSRLTQARTLALRRQDYVELATIDAQLAELPAAPVAREEDSSDVLTKVNERNRKANMDAIRKAEIQEAERKRRERKLQAASRASSTPVPKLSNSLSRFALAL